MQSGKPRIQPYGHQGNWVVPRNYRGRGTTFGYFFCKKCRKEWMSAYALKGYGQACFKCKIYFRGSFYWLNDAESSVSYRKPLPDNRKPHMRRFCQACKYGLCPRWQDSLARDQSRSLSVRNRSRRVYRAPIAARNRSRNVSREPSRLNRVNQPVQRQNYREKSELRNRPYEQNRLKYRPVNRPGNQQRDFSKYRPVNRPANQPRNFSKSANKSYYPSKYQLANKPNYPSRYQPRRQIQYKCDHLRPVPQIIPIRRQSPLSNSPR